MKPFIKRILLLTVFVVFCALQGIGQPPMPSQHGEEENQDVPVGSGLVILLALGAGYGAKKVYDARRKLRQ